MSERGSAVTDRYKTISEIAAELRVCYGAVWNQVQAGRLEAVQLGGAHSAIRIPAKSYRDFLAKSRRSGDDAVNRRTEGNQDLVSKTG
jgi:hypothetical protein